MKRLLITGGCGFIGSNLLLYWHQKYRDTVLINVDSLTYASNQKFVDSLNGSERYVFRKADIGDRDVVRDFIAEFQPDGIIHLAAESHVDNSILDPGDFIRTNIVGTFNLLEETRRHWGANGGFAEKRFHHVSTDEVYGSLGAEGFFTEETPYDPSSPYSASKAGSDHLVRAYGCTYNMPIVTTNCSNNFGPNQHAEKLIPTVIRKALAGANIPVYGAGANIRDWLFVGDHCEAIDFVFHHGKSGETYNIGSRNEWKNLDLVRTICAMLGDLRPVSGGYEKLITFVTDRLGHDLRYAIDPKKLETLGWSPRHTFRESLLTTIRWYLDNPEFLSGCKLKS